MAGEKIILLLAILTFASSQLECPQLYCSTKVSNLCYNYYPLTGSAIVNPCPSGMSCPYRGRESEDQLECEETYQKVIKSLPGSKCSTTMPCIDLDHVTCVKGYCSGVAENSACDVTQQCLPGLYCKSLTCQPLIKGGAPCHPSDNCTYGYVCNKGVCTILNSIPSGSPVDTVNCGYEFSYLCESNACYNDPSGKSTCINPYMSNIVNNEPCTICEGVSVTGSLVLSQKAGCTCGLSGQSHCPKFSGDVYFQKTLNLVKGFMLSNTRKKCNIYSFEDCLLSYDKKLYTEFMYYSAKVQYGTLAYGGDDCLVKALVPKYYEAEKNYRDAELEDVGIFAAIAVVIYEVFRAYFG